MGLLTPLKRHTYRAGRRVVREWPEAGERHHGLVELWVERGK